MRRYEVAAENGHRVRVEVADDLDDDEAQLEAVMLAGERDPDIWYAGAYPATNEAGQPLPVGWDGGDAEEAEKIGASLDPS